MPAQPSLRRSLLVIAVALCIHPPLRAEEKAAIPNEVKQQVIHAIQIANQGQRDEAEKELLAALAAQEAAPDANRAGILLIRETLGALFLARNKAAESELQLRLALMEAERAYGPQHPDVMKFCLKLASALEMQRNMVSALEIARLAEAGCQRALSADHPLNKTAPALRKHIEAALPTGQQPGTSDFSSLGWKLKRPEVIQYRAEQARVLAAISERAFGPEHPDTLKHRMDMADALRDKRSYAEAEKEFRALVPLNARVHGPNHEATLQVRLKFAQTLAGAKKDEEAETEYRAMIAAAERNLEPGHRYLNNAYDWFCEFLIGRRKYKEALEPARKLEDLEKKHPDKLQPGLNMGSIFLQTIDAGLKAPQAGSAPK